MNCRLKTIVLKWSAACSDLLLHRRERLRVWKSVFDTIGRVGENLNIAGFLGSVTMAVGVVWEIGEFGIDRFFGTH